MKGTDLIHNGEIVLEGAVMQSGWEDWFSGGIITASLFRGALAEFEGDVTVRVNSPGGDPTEGEAIRAMIEDHAGTVTVKVNGDAMSAASLMIMSADVIEMSAGSLMMIHDPSMLTWGDADGHRKGAEILDVMADTYAGVYAARSGKSAEEVRTQMKDELWMGPADAVEEGYADRIAGAATTDDDASAEMLAPIIEAARARHEATITMLRKARLPDDDAKASQKPDPTAAGGPNPTQSVEPKEVTMTKPKTPAVTQPDPAPQDTTAATEAATMEERQRAKDIRTMAAPWIKEGRLTEADVDVLIDDGTPSVEAGARLMATMSLRAPVVDEVVPAPRATITRDETDTKLEGMITAIMGEREGPASDYRGLRIKGLALELGGGSKIFSEPDRIRAGMTSVAMMGGAHGVSDFSYVTAEVMNRTLLAEYRRREPNWQIVAERMTATDFREMHSVRIGGDFQLKPIKENGEIEMGVLADEAEGLRVERRARGFTLTFEAIVNDDMGAFQRIPRELSISSRTMEASMVWSRIRENAVLKSDSTAIFDETHNNLAASAGAISVATVGAGRTAMWQQRAFGSKDSDDFLEIEATTLLVPPSRETVALQFVGATVPTKDSDKNPYKATMNAQVVPHLGAAAGGSDSAWYLVSQDYPPIAVANLEGYENPVFLLTEGMSPRGVTMSYEHIFGAAPYEYRGVYKNDG